MSKNPAIRSGKTWCMWGNVSTEAPGRGLRPPLFQRKRKEIFDLFYYVLGWACFHLD